MLLNDRRFCISGSNIKFEFYKHVFFLAYPSNLILGEIELGTCIKKKTVKLNQLLNLTYKKSFHIST